jgi:ParB family transcriptional regulator, chromosome partitioning protein
MQLELGQLDLRYADLRIQDMARERRLIASLLEHGQQTPVLAVRVEEAWVLIDGYVRVAALRKLAHDLVEAAVLEVPEAEALVLGHRLDNGRARTALEEGWLLRELCERHGVAQRELARRLDRSTSWVSRRLGLVTTLPEAVQETVRGGKLSVQAATKYLVPLARSNAEQCEQLVRGLGGEHVSVRQMQRLYVAWKQGDEEERQRLCEQPRLFLRATEADDESAQDESDEHAATMRDLSILASVCLRLCRRLTESDGPVMQRARVAQRGAWQRAERAFATLRTHMDEQEMTDAGPRHSNGNLASARRRPRRTTDSADAAGVARSSPQGPA